VCSECIVIAVVQVRKDQEKGRHRSASVSRSPPALHSVIMTKELSPSIIRAINLIEVLIEDLEDEGVDASAIELPPNYQDVMVTWPEDRIRRYFDDIRQGKSPGAVLEQAVPRIPEPSKETFDLWFPGLARSGTARADPSKILVCFPNAGNAEDMYTSEGSGARKQPSPLLEYCREHDVQVLAPQYPGRAMRLKETPITTAKGMAEALFDVLAPSLISTPWILLAHSVGTWISYEFLLLCKSRGVPLPERAFLSAMPSPDIEMGKRPWRQQRSLHEEAFKDECREWDISEVVFSEAMWGMYQPLLRADFTMFDEYPEDQERRASWPAFDFPIQAFWGTKDRRVTEEMVMGWANVTSGSFRIERVDGNHLWPLDLKAKKVWLERIVSRLSSKEE
jgi:medium-chain acyl-[acyl-carrier-protein] hydrolase